MFSHVTQSQRKLILPLTLLLGGGVIVALLVAHFISVSANPGDKSNAEAQYPGIVGSGIDTCVLCHTASGPPSLNPYGAAYFSNGRNRAALVAIEGADSDGDGVSNLAEITALTFPGDPQSIPSPATVTATATTTPSNTPTAKPTATGQPTATKTNTPPPGSSMATVVPTQTGTVATTKTPKPTASVVPCKDDDDQDNSVLSTGQHEGDDRCETEVPHMTKTPKPTSSVTPCVEDDNREDMDKSSSITIANHDDEDGECEHEGAGMTKTPKPTEGARMTRTPKATEGGRMTRTPKATESHSDSQGNNTSAGAGNSNSSNLIQTIWSDLQKAFRSGD